MEAHRTASTVCSNGTLVLRDLQFEDGVEVNVVLTPVEAPLSEEEEEALEWLRGKVLRYDRPHDPAVDPDEWDANRGVLGDDT